MSGRKKYTQQNHWCLSQVPLRLKWIEKLKRHRSPGTDQIPAEMIKAGDRTIRSEISKLIKVIWNKEELLEYWKQSIIAPVYKNGDNKHFSKLQAYQFRQQNFTEYSAIEVNSIRIRNYLGISVRISTQQVNYRSYTLHI